MSKGGRTLDILSYGVNHCQEPIGRLLISTVYHLTRMNPLFSGIWVNGLACRDLISGLNRLGANTLGGFSGPAERAKELAETPPIERIVLAANKTEQHAFRREYNPECLVCLPPTTNTLEHAKSLVDYSIKNGIITYQLLCREIQGARGWLTIVKQIQKANHPIFVLPGAYLESNRDQLPPKLQKLAVMVESLKLWRYQCKRDVATFEEAEKYIRWLHHQPKTSINNLFVMY